ncbi:MAG: AsmA protein [Candidatus Azotimanducaceae bacterium]|jgi:AsmA protein
MSRLLMTILVLIGLIVAAFIGLLVLLDNPDAYKQKLSGAFQSQTGYGLEINGSLDWQYFPPIAIKLTDVAITTPKSTQPLASLKSASVDLKVFPLIFGGSVEVSGLNIDGLIVNAEIDANGVGNWEVSSDTNTTSEATPASEQQSSDNSLSVDIGGINITDANINYIDRAGNSHYILNLSQFRTGPLGTGITTDISGDLTLEDKIGNMSADVMLRGKAAINESLDEFTLENFAITSTLRQSESAPITSTLNLNGKVNTSSGVANLNNSEFSIADMKLAFGIDATDIFGATAFTGNIKAPTFNAKQLLVALDADPGPTENPNALTKVSLDANIKGSLNQIALTNLNLVLDQSKLTGTVTASIPASSTGKTGVSFDLKVDSIIASDYLEPIAEIASTPADNNAATAAIADSEVIPVETLSETNIDGTFTIDTLQYETWNATDIKLMVKNQRQQLSVTGTAKVYAGSINFNLNSNYAGATPNTTSAFGLTGIDITKALEFDAITGTLELNADHTFKGGMMSQLVNSLNGKSTFSIANGTLDVRPIKQIAAIYDGLQGTQSGIGEWPDMLPFDFLQGDHNFKAGITKDQTLNASVENMRITGKGGIDYFANTMIYDLDATLLETAGQFKVNQNLVGIRFPLHCEGSLDAEPIKLCLPDRSAITKLIRDLATQKIKQQGTDALQKKIDAQIPDELKEKAKDLLKGLFN